MFYCGRGRGHAHEVEIRKVIPHGASETATLKAMQEEQVRRQMLLELRLLKALTEGAILCIELGTIVNDPSWTEPWMCKSNGSAFRLGPYIVKRE